jgi:hypothetical protein
MTATSAPKTDNRALKALLKRLGACSEARDAFGKLDMATAWAECERGDHLLWVVARLNVDRRLIARAAAACAETALQYVPAGEDRPRLAIEAVRAWADDPTEANLERVRIARRAAAYAAYAATDASSASSAAYAAASASYAAASAADASYTAADASYAASDARKQARAATLKRCADLVRSTISYDVVLEAVRALDAVPAKGHRSGKCG